MAKKTKLRKDFRLESLEPRQLLAATPQLVGDFNLAPPSQELQTDNAWLGNELFFAADDGGGDVELWKSDGTPAGTVRVKDIRAGAPGSLPRDFAAVDGRVLFTAYSEEFGRELWSTDGTQAGTVLVHDLAPGAATSSVNSLTPTGGKVYFRNENELWSTDGTDANTQLMSYVAAEFLTKVGDHLYYTTHTAGETVLWKSDGTLADPQQVMAFSSNSPTELHVVGDWIYFVTVGNGGSRLWKSNGTVAGTAVVANAGTHIGILAATDDFLLFETTANYGTSDRVTIWRAAPSQETSERVQDFTVSYSSSVPEYPESFTRVGNHVYFTVGRQLLRIDGDSERPEPVAAFQNPGQLREAGGRLYVIDDRIDTGGELWRSDGTEEGTRLVATDAWVMADNGQTALFWSTSAESRGLWAAIDDDAQPSKLHDALLGPSAHTSASIASFDVAGKAFFTADGRLWQTDGEHTTWVEAAPPIGNGQIAVKDQLYFFSAKDASRHAELWRTDVSADGTVRVAGSDDGFVDPSGLTNSGGTLYFWAEGTDRRMKLWMFDRAQSKAVVVKDFAWPRGTSYSHSMADLSGELFFTFRRSSEGDTELWKANGPTGQAEFVAAIPAWNVSLMAAEHQLFLNVSGINVSQLWRSDGTAEGTYLLTDTNMGYPAVAGERLFFLGSSNETGEELWVSDGTVEGTRLVRDIVPGRQGCGLANMVALGDTVIFSAIDSAGHLGLWKSNGTAEGSVLIREMEAFPIGSGDGVVYFHGSDPSTGSELWKSDGTEEGTVRVADLNPGPDGSRKYRTTGTAAVINGRLYFTGDDGFHGNEFWSIPLSAAEEPADFAGDYNGDGRVEQGDLDLVLLHWGQSANAAPEGWIGELPGGMIDQDELDAVLLNWGMTTSQITSAEQSPAATNPLVGAGDGFPKLGESIAAQRPIAHTLNSLLDSAQTPTMR